MNPIEAVNAAVTALNKAIQNAGGLWEAFEGNEEINSASRAIVATVAAQYGEAWLVKINLYGPGPHTPMWQANSVRNWEADYVLLAYDQPLVDMILARHEAPYTGTKEDGKRFDAIAARIRDLGGKVLFWS
jgi:hypothetical protein